MKKKTYREEMLRTGSSFKPEEMLSLGGMGLSEEAGEVLGLIKKHVFHKHPLNREKLISELGDVRWYFELLLHSLGTTIEEVEEVNIKKLHKRYPEGFSTEKSINRKQGDE